MNRRAYSDQQIVLNEVVANGAGTAFDAMDYRNIEIDVIQTGFTGTVKIMASNADVKPDFTAAASLTNPWALVKCINLADGSAVNGATGISGTATTSITMLEANTNGIRWICPIVSGYAAGTLTVKVRGVGNI